MKTITLTKAQRALLKDRLTEVRDGENGEFDLDIVIDYLLTVNVQGWVETDGYVEDDYFNGTGGYVETYRAASVHLTAIVFDLDAGENETCNVDETTINEIDNYLNAA